jgi:hypothetical protein
MPPVRERAWEVVCGDGGCHPKAASDEQDKANPEASGTHATILPDGAAKSRWWLPAASGSTGTYRIAR